MGKEVEGWRDPRDWDWKSGDPYLDAVMLANRSDDGWYCPHCRRKETLQEAHCGEGVTKDEYFDLIENYTKVKFNCDECGKDYYVKCIVTKKFLSCEDDEFKE